MFSVVGAWSLAVLQKTGDVFIAGYNLIASLIGK